MMWVRNRQNPSIFMRTDSQKMTDASLWGPKRPQECLLRLNQCLSVIKPSIITEIYVEFKNAVKKMDFFFRRQYSEEKIHLFYRIIKVKISGGLPTDYNVFC